MWTEVSDQIMSPDGDLEDQISCMHTGKNYLFIYSLISFANLPQAAKKKPKTLVLSFVQFSYKSMLELKKKTIIANCEYSAHV